MELKKFPLPLCVFALGLSPVAMKAATCSVKDKVPSSARVFAKADDQSEWREYSNAGQQPDVQLDSGMSAQVVQHKKEIPSVTIVKPGESYWTYTRYCFADDGHLEGVSFEVRTQLGWGYRVDGTASGGGFGANSHEYFRTKDGKTIEKPEGVADAPTGLAPTMYLSVSQLPFAGLLKPATRTHGKHGAALTLVSTAN
ncbi:MAG: hypothetical protein WBA18_22390 [Terracidiphilus sp.]